MEGEKISEKWDQRMWEWGVRARACVCGGACVPVRMGAWVCVGIVQVVMKRILHCDIFNTTKFHSSSTTHGNNLNSKQHQCVHSCVCVYTRVWWSPVTSDYSSYSCRLLFFPLIFLCLQNNARAHTHINTHTKRLYLSLSGPPFSSPLLVFVSFVQYFMPLRAYLFWALSFFLSFYIRPLYPLFLHLFLVLKNPLSTHHSCCPLPLSVPL